MEGDQSRRAIASGTRAPGLCGIPWRSIRPLAPSHALSTLVVPSREHDINWTATYYSFALLYVVLAALHVLPPALVRETVTPGRSDTPEVFPPSGLDVSTRKLDLANSICV